MFTRVLLAMDLTPKSEILLPCLYSLCPDTNTEIILAYVFDEEEDADPYSSSYKKVYSKLQGYANELMRNGYEEVSIEMPWGEVFEEITRVGNDKEVDLTLVASHGKGFLEVRCWAVRPLILPDLRSGHCLLPKPTVTATILPMMICCVN